MCVKKDLPFWSVIAKDSFLKSAFEVVFGLALKIGALFVLSRTTITRLSQRLNFLHFKIVLQDSHTTILLVEGI